MKVDIFISSEFFVTQRFYLLRAFFQPDYYNTQPLACQPFFETFFEKIKLDFKTSRNLLKSPEISLFLVCENRLKFLTPE